MSDWVRRLRLAIAGGGTGGHVLPALAVVDELRQRDQIEDALWIGSHDGVEGDSARRAGIRFVSIPTGKLRRYLSPRNISDAARIPIGVLAARRELRAFRPDVLLSTGGFVSVPAVIAARGVAPVITHEQTAVLGLANRINARFSAVLAISHQQSESAARAVHRRVAVTGNPVRAGLAEGDRERGLAHYGFTPDLPLVYVTGGARGASPINQRVAELIPEIFDHTQILHQTGPASANDDAGTLRARHAALPDHLQPRYAIVDFVRDELPDVYAAADIVIGRAGAGTVAELALVGLPAILIPLPGAGGDEQMLNARILGDREAAIVVSQSEATPERLREELLALLRDDRQRQQMADAARSVAMPDAAIRLAELLVSVATEQRSATARRG